MVRELQKSLGLKDDGVIGRITTTEFGKKNKLNPIECAHFFGQCDHETAGFTAFVENLNYSAEGLLRTFPKYFNEKTAILNARKPQNIANIAYANRMGNGDPASGDGWKYRGRTPIHLTGKANYAEAAKHFGVDFVSNPELTLEYGFDIALWYFRKNRIFALCKDLSDKSITAVTKRINGGLNGIEQRIKKTKRYYYE